MIRGASIHRVPTVVHFSPMVRKLRRWTILLAAAGLIAAAVSCEHTVCEPGEVEHGGVFLHASPDNASTRHFLIF